MKYFSKKISNVKSIVYYFTHRFDFFHTLKLVLALVRRDITLATQAGFGDYLMALCYADYLDRVGWRVKILLQSPKVVKHKMFFGANQGRVYKVANTEEDAL